MKNIFFFLLTALIFFGESCKKDSQFLYRNSGTWEIQSMQLDFLNASGATDSTINSDITGFFMFYDTPTTGSDPYYLSTNGITVRGNESHTAHFYKSDGKIITLVTTIGQPASDRAYTISDHKRNEMTLDYTGAANGMYNFYTGNLKEHIVLKRIKF